MREKSPGLCSGVWKTCMGLWNVCVVFILSESFKMLEQWKQKDRRDGNKRFGHISPPDSSYVVVINLPLQYCWSLCPLVLMGTPNAHLENVFKLLLSLILRRTMRIAQTRSFVVCQLSRKTFSN